ncbi:hypothetical protein [Porphyromonas phage phage005b_ATCC49417]|uniref:Uncharacterized protein n=1 Tax=Porphyromonas phage phage005a_ATCC49417 TaxID=3154097 RepID=A0AAT9J7Z5_9VIRU
MELWLIIRYLHFDAVALMAYNKVLPAQKHCLPLQC